MNEKKQSFLGRGWAFPPSFNPHTKAALMCSGLEDIEQSIRILLNTTPGERLMQPAFGCPLKLLVFEAIDNRLYHRLRDMIAYALLEFEPRVLFEELDVTDHRETDGFLHLRLFYTVIRTNTRHNLVFPFYCDEGTNIKT